MLDLGDFGAEKQRTEMNNTIKLIADNLSPDSKILGITVIFLSDVIGQFCIIIYQNHLQRVELKDDYI